MDFSTDYILENTMVRLEPLDETHIPQLVHFGNETAIWTYFLGRSNGAANLKGYIEDAIKHRLLHKEYPFAVFDKRTKAYAGSTRLFDYSSLIKNIRLGYTWYGKAFQGTGLNKNCKFLLFEFALETLGMERVGLGAHSENTRSIAAMKSVGCSEEGCLRNLFPSLQNAGRADGVLYGITRDDWINGYKNQLKQKL